MNLLSPFVAGMMETWAVWQDEELDADLLASWSCFLERLSTFVISMPGKPDRISWALNVDSFAAGSTGFTKLFLPDTSFPIMGFKSESADDTGIGMGIDVMIPFGGPLPLFNDCCSLELRMVTMPFSLVKMAAGAHSLLLMLLRSVSGGLFTFWNIGFFRVIIWLPDVEETASGAAFFFLRLLFFLAGASDEQFCWISFSVSTTITPDFPTFIVELGGWSWRLVAL